MDALSGAIIVTHPPQRIRRRARESGLELWVISRIDREWSEQADERTLLVSIGERS